MATHEPGQVYKGKKLPLPKGIVPAPNDARQTFRNLVGKFLDASSTQPQDGIHYHRNLPFGKTYPEITNLDFWENSTKYPATRVARFRVWGPKDVVQRVLQALANDVAKALPDGSWRIWGNGLYVYYRTQGRHYRSQYLFPL